MKETKRKYRIHIQSTTEQKMRTWAKAKSKKLADDVEEFVKSGGKIQQVDNAGDVI